MFGGHTRSCGCLKTEERTSHGMSHSPEYVTWDSMVQRVTNPNSTGAKNYFDKGVDMDPRWLFFEEFYKDMGPRPSGLTLERRDSTKGYWPWNCEWATRKVQNNNTSRNRFISVEGVRMTVAQAADKFHMNYSTLFNRLRRGQSVKDALMPV